MKGKAALPRRVKAHLDHAGTVSAATKLMTAPVTTPVVDPSAGSYNGQELNAAPGASSARPPTPGVVPAPGRI
ncbi:MAG: hypothetical protein WCO60_07015 [Verrucomicrobiota bacterium]